MVLVLKILICSMMMPIAKIYIFLWLKGLVLEKKKYFSIMYVRIKIFIFSLMMGIFINNWTSSFCLNSSLCILPRLRPNQGVLDFGLCANISTTFSLSHTLHMRLSYNAVDQGPLILLTITCLQIILLLCTVIPLLTSKYLL